MPGPLNPLRMVSPPQRGRVGVACGLLAVAVLSSLFVNWSPEYPVERSPSEQDLFGDLADLRIDDDARPTFPDRAMSSVQQRGPHSQLDARGLTTAEKKSDSFDSFLAVPVARRAPEHQPRFVQPVKYQVPARKPLVWLSGGIEVDVEDEASPSADRAPTTSR